MKTKIIAFEGVDGSGKGTQSELLYKYLKEHGYDAYLIANPRYGTPQCRIVESFLQGELDIKNPYTIASIFSTERALTYETEWKQIYDGGDRIIIMDRYIGSNMFHQLARLEKEEWPSFLRWIRGYEYGALHLPMPDITIFLDVHPAVIQENIHARAVHENSSPDVNERDSDYMYACSIAAHYCARTDKWRRILCTRNISTNQFEMMDPRAIHHLVRDELVKGGIIRGTS